MEQVLLRGMGRSALVLPVYARVFLFNHEITSNGIPIIFYTCPLSTSETSPRLAI